jgi:hypothetical protein
MLKKEGLIDDSFIKMIMSWRHNSGFSVHNQVWIKAADEKGIENVSQYIIRNTFSLSKVKYTEKTGTVLYRSKFPSPTRRNDLLKRIAMIFLLT